MSVVGIDFGAQSTKVGVARNKGIDIVRHSSPSTQFSLPLRALPIRSSYWPQVITNWSIVMAYRSPTKFPTDLLRKFAHSLAYHDFLCRRHIRCPPQYTCYPAVY